MAERRSIAGALRAAAQGAAPEPTERPTPPPDVGQARPYRARTREGKKMIAAPVDPAARLTLKVLAAELDRKAEDLIREALRDLFVKYGKPGVV